MEKIEILLSEEEMKQISGGQLIEKELKINDKLETIRLGADIDDIEILKTVEQPQKFQSAGINQKTIPGGNSDIIG